MSLTVEAGEIHGLLGPNGAGKTTLVKILTTVLLPTSGSARVFGHDVVQEAGKVRPLISVTLERGLHHWLTARQTLRFWAAMYQLPKEEIEDRCTAVLDRFGLLSRADSRVHTYSRGMQQRLHLARALLPEPRLVFLDEPTLGIDPVGRRDFRAMLSELRTDGITVLIATHDLVEAETVCDRVTLLNSGRILATESPATLASWVGGRTWVDVEDAPGATLARIRGLPGVTAVEPTATGARVEVEAEEALRAVLMVLVDDGCSRFGIAETALDDVYLALIDGQRATAAS
ncbi:ABC transporter ATP-binding protein [Kitasatospora aureofaciens]|uniref:ABC transporter ATP-binding protein n=1 Tax=Kitasatospora aureofaciens TaxID=1894 RepID=UPI001E001679|nr:ABC transporter ATP-binding protein [Kitasatospora aureofaciens]HJD81118.1 ABC transporter ATP-binding protein [Kitasatospora aureofaciens]